MAFRRSCLGSVVFLTLLPLLNACGDVAPAPSSHDDQPATRRETLDTSQHETLQFPAQILVDKQGLPHLFAQSETDVVYLQGYVHARDRLFQMDVLRRQADGTLAELLGEAALASDVQLRTFGVRRGAERSLPLVSPEGRAALKAYAAGVNTYVSRNALPPEYAALEVTQFRPWTDVDSVAVLKLLLFQLSFDINEIQQTLVLRAYQAAGQQQGFNGAKLYLEDTNRTAPFDPASTLPDALRAPSRPRGLDRTAAQVDSQLSSSTLRLAREFMERMSQAPYAAAATRSGDGDSGSNQWVVSGRLSATGQPLIANDPHLATGVPAILYQQQLHAPAAGINAIGASLPGAPYVGIGNNQRIAWAATTNPTDVTDSYEEHIVADPASPSGLSTMYKGALEPVVALPQSFRFNVPGDGVTDNLRVEAPGTRVPPAVLIVPRRNQGPIVQLDLDAGVAISVQYAGSGGTRELDAFRGLVRARSIDEFGKALRFFDVGAQNFSCAEVNGDIAYFMSGKVPLREDLQAGKVNGLSPMFLRNGQGGNEWLPSNSADPTLPFEVLPEAEMPRGKNPPRGYFVNANNDMNGNTLDNDPLNEQRPNGGIQYFGALYDTGIRAGRITQLLDERLAQRGRLTTSDLKAIQADTVMNDARYYTPVILTAFANAKKPSAHPALQQAASEPRVAEAVARLAAWDQSTPTGLREGYDANDAPGNLREPSRDEIQHSIAATIFSIWRNQFLSNVIVATLSRRGLPFFNTARRESMAATKNLLDNFEQRRGVGASGVDFFEVPGIEDAATRRDLIALRSLAGALDVLAGANYAAAFKRSTNQDDYRWGRLHRITFPHPIGGPFSIPPAFGAFPAPFGPDLPGLPVDGGLFTVDIATNQILRDAAPDALNAFIVRGIPVQRYVARVRLFGLGFDAETSLPGGESAIPGSPFYLNLLEPYLTNETYDLRQSLPELSGNIASFETLLPARR
jgi:penicillin G amidase